MKDNGLLILLLGVGGLVWYASSQASAPPSQTTTGTTGGALPPSSPPSVPASNPAHYSGPSLAQMYASLQSVVLSRLGIDPALLCTQGMQGLGFGQGSKGASPAVPVPDMQGGHIRPVAGGIPPRTVATAPSGGTGCVPSSIHATYEVFNYYLSQSSPQIGTVPNAPSGDPQVSLSDYWAWAAPQLQQQIAGLSGFPVMQLTRPGNGESQGPKQARSYMYGRWSA